MPQVLHRHMLDLVAIHQLAKYRLYSIAETGEECACARFGVVPGSFERNHEVDLLAGQFIRQTGTPVVSVAQDYAETT